MTHSLGGTDAARAVTIGPATIEEATSAAATAAVRPVTGRSVAAPGVGLPAILWPMSSAWELVLAVALIANALLGVGYRVYRLTKQGPVADVVGQTILGIVLIGLAAADLADQSWARWPALGYALLFAVIVMPVWTLAVLLPMRPRALDYAFAVVYWILLIVIVVSAVAV